MSISIVMPVLDEAGILPAALSRLSESQHDWHELIVVDGGSTDGSLALAQLWTDYALPAPRGRASQMNFGATLATSEVLLFLHADTRLPEDAAWKILDGLSDNRHEWGRFDVQLSGRHPLLRVVEYTMNLRSRLTGIATGDQAIFVRRSLFERVGGFPDIPLMEDIALSRLLRKHGMPLCLRDRVLTSSRRWEHKGVLRTILLMWRLRLLYALGVPAEKLARHYA